MDRFMLFKKDQQFGRTRTPVQTQSVWTCKICKTQSAKYTCPRCNLPYCSLECYKSEKHGDCTEAFYKDCVMEELKQQNVSDETKHKMMDTLKRMHDEAADDPEAPGMENEEASTTDLADRLRGVDLDEDEEEIWNCLTEEERREFQEFLASENLSQVIQLWEPWWMTEISHPKITEVGASDIPTDRTDMPVILDAPDLSGLFTRHPPSPSVAFSCVNLLYSYVLISRVYNGDHCGNAQQAAENLFELSAGLRGDRILASPEEAVVVATIESNSSSIHTLLSREVKSNGLSDLVRILSDVVFAQAAFSDVICLLKKVWKASPSLPEQKKKLAAGFKKVEYLMAYLDGHWEDLVKLIPHIQRQQAEFLQDELEQSTARDAVAATAEKKSSGKKPKIEEL